MDIILPRKLEIGDEVRIVAPSLSYKIIAPELREIAIKRLKEMGLKVSFGKWLKIPLTPCFCMLLSKRYAVKV